MKTVAIVILALAVGLVEPHGHLWKPLARTSIFFDPSFGTEGPYEWNAQGWDCGAVNQNQQMSTCGRCGERNGNRDASQGGQFDKGIPTANYSSGQVKLAQL